MILVVSDYYSDWYAGDHQNKLVRFFTSVDDNSIVVFIQPIGHIWLV